MSHEHEALELAVASLDFELTPDEQARMDAGLAACAECRAVAASHRETQRLLERLPMHDASPIVRQRVLRRSLVPPRTSQWQVLLVAAALFGLLLAAGAAAIGAFRTDPLDPISKVPLVSPSIVGEVVSPAPPSSASASVPPSPPGAPVGPEPAIADPSAGERLLLGYIPQDLLGDCVRSRTTPSDTAIQGDVAGLDCAVGRDGITEARYFLFASASQLDTWWQTGIKEMGLQPDSGGCPDGREGETPFDGGRLQCFSVASGARLRWFDDAQLVYGVVVGSGDDLRATVDWWTATHRVTGVKATPTFNAVEQRLVDEAPADIVGGCVPYRIVGTEATAVEGSVGAIDCLIDSSLIIDVGYFRFDTLADLESWWERRLPGLPVERGSGGCLDGSPGERGTARGRIACYVVDGEARIRWTDEDRLVYGTVNGATSDLPRIFEWWDRRHRS